MSRKMILALFVIAALAILTLAMVAGGSQSAKAPAVDNAMSDYWQRHPSISIPVTGLDLRSTDYALRHPELSPARVSQPDLSDYAARHPGMALGAARPVDITDYYFRHRDR